MYNDDFDVVHLALKSQDNRYHLEPAKADSDSDAVISVSVPSECNESENYQIIEAISKRVSNLFSISKLSFRNCRLHQIPLALSVLKLTELDLSHNLLENVPACLQIGLENIETLNLGYNKIQNFDVAPKCVHSLRSLDLSWCHLYRLPVWLLELHCAKLKRFVYNGNCAGTFEEVSVPENKVKTVEFKNCSLSSKHLYYFRELGRLESLDLSNEHESLRNGMLKVERLLDKPKWSSSIRVLKLSNLGLPELPASIGEMVELRELHLDNNWLNNLPPTLVRLKNLQILNVSSNSLYYLPNNISALRNLRRLTAANNMLTTVDLTGMRHLAHVDLYNNDLDSVVLSGEFVERIDLELNYVTEPWLICEGYEAKMVALRRELVKARTFGCKIDECVEEVFSECSDFSEASEIVDDVENDYKYSAIVTEENWDDDYINTQVVQCYADVTDSDNEYQGLKVRSRSITKSSGYPPNNDEYLYEDVY